MRSYSSSRAQGVIEYLLVVIAVTVVLISAVLVKGGIFVKGVNAVLESPGKLIDQRKGELVFPSNEETSSCNYDDMSPSTPCGQWFDDGCGGTFMGLYCGPYTCEAKQDGSGGYECR